MTLSDNHKHQHDSCVEISKTANVGDCPNELVGPVLTPAGETIARLPIDLGIYEVTTHLESRITFPEPVQQIKDVKKTVEIVQCRLMTPSAAEPSTFEAGIFPLFLQGFVRKNIQYETPNARPTDGSCVSGDVKSLTVRIPFKCTTMVDLERPVLLPVAGTREEFDFARQRKLGHGFPEKDHYMSSDLSEFHQTSTQYYNSLPYCELITSTITGWEEAVDRETAGNSPINEGYFTTIVEKMMVQFTVKVLQDQQVRLTAL